MADRPKGNLFFEFIIVILVVALIGTILYPKMVWQKEDALEGICRSRMEAISSLEFGYINTVYSYNDTLRTIKDLVLSDIEAIAYIDSTINWDNLVLEEDLEQLVLAKNFPTDLQSLISGELGAGRPLRNAGNWDGLVYKLIAALETKLPAEGLSESLDSTIVWPVLLGENQMLQMIETSGLTSSQVRRMEQELRRGTPVNDTRYWDRVAPVFYTELKNIINTAKRSDVWEKKDQDEWKEIKRVEWEAAMDTLSAEEQDSLWIKNQKGMWDKIKEVVWRRDRKNLWKAEKETWPVENESMWRRNISQKWESDRKKIWAEEQQSAQEDINLFKTKKDSLWRVVSDSIRTAEYDAWKIENKKYIDDVVEGLWQVDRHIDWEPGAYQTWQDEKNTDPEARWTELKEELWNTGWMEHWAVEEKKLGMKESALRRLDLAVPWQKTLGESTVASIVNSLTLPGNEDVWLKLTEKSDEKDAALHRYGLVGLFRNILIDSVDNCPIAKVPYMIMVDDTSTIPQFSVYCPIEETTDLAVAKFKIPAPEMEETEDMSAEAAKEPMMDASAADDTTMQRPDTLAAVEPEVTEEPVETDIFVVARVVDPVTKDTSKVQLTLPTAQKLLGGGKIRPHGFIESGGKKSWEKKGR